MRFALCFLFVSISALFIIGATTFTSPVTIPLTSIENNIQQQTIGSPTINGLPANPIVVQPAVSFSPDTTLPVLSKQAMFGDTTGRILDILTDGVLPISIAPGNRSAYAANPALVVGISPNPNYQCPYTASINVSANATIITNQGGKRLYVCNAIVINGTTAQSVTIAEGTGTACATNPTYWLGGSGGTAALAANGGFSLMAINWAMQSVGDNVCILVSGSTNVSGSLTYGIY